MAKVLFFHPDLKKDLDPNGHVLKPQKVQQNKPENQANTSVHAQLNIGPYLSDKMPSPISELPRDRGLREGLFDGHRGQPPRQVHHLGHHR